MIAMTAGSFSGSFRSLLATDWPVSITDSSVYFIVKRDSDDRLSWLLTTVRGGRDGAADAECRATR
jgi:hypothetical protein